jgi:WD40 repeat protein
MVIRRSGLTAPATVTVAALADGHPALVLLDNPVTGLDPSTLASWKILAVAAVDPTRTPAHVLASLAPAAWHELDPLPDEVCERIARRWVADDPEGLDGLDLDGILAAAGGNPGSLHRKMAQALEERSRRRIEASLVPLRSAREDVAALRARVAGGVRGIRRGRTLARPEADEPDESGRVRPYRGLQAYRRDDAALFHGRDAVIGQLVARVADTALVAVVGASGTGKSSVVQAGLMVSLAQGCLPGSGAWPQHVVTPADHLPELTHTPSVLVVDQFEQAWVVHDDEKRTRYVDQLLDLADAGHRVVLTLRADHLDRCSEHSRLRDAVADGAVLIGPLGADELIQVITGPAEFAGCDVEPQLVDQILAEVRGLPAPLPLLSTALLDTWERAGGHTLTMEAYRAGGGVGGSLARRAETVLADLGTDEQAAARRILLRLAAGERGALVRRRCPYDEAVHDQAAAAAVDALADARLITVDAAGIEVVHEALFENWPRLRDWLDEDQQGRRLRAHLAPAALEWATAGRPESDLYRGVRLDAATEWADRHTTDLTPLEREFLAASQARAGEELHAERAKATREARARRRLRSILIAMTLAAAVAVAATVVAVGQRSAATKQASLALARQLGAAALVNQPLDHSLLLAVSAVRLNDNVDTRGDLLAALQRSPAARITLDKGGSEYYGLCQSCERPTSLAVSGKSNIPVGGTTGGHLLTWTPAGSRRPVSTTFFSSKLPVLLAARPGTDEVAAAGGYEGSLIPNVTLWDAVHARQARPDLTGATEPVTSMAWTPDGRWLAATQAAGDTLVWDLDHPTQPPLHFAPGGRPGRLVTAAGNHAFTIVDRSGTASVWPIGGTAAVRRMSVGGDVTAVASNPDGSLLAVGHEDGSVGLWDRVARGHDLTGHLRSVSTLTFSHDGRLLASGGKDDEEIVSDPGTGRVLSRLTGLTGSVVGAAFTSDDRGLYAIPSDGPVIGWDLGNGNNLGRSLSAPGARSTTWMTVSPTGTVATLSTDGLAHLWSPNDDSPSQPIRVGKSKLISGAFSADGNTLTTVDTSGAHIVNIRSRQSASLGYVAPTPVQDVEYSPDGRTVAIVDADHVYLYDATSHRPIGKPKILYGMPQLTGRPQRVTWSPDSRRFTLTYQLGFGLYDLNSSAPVVWPSQRQIHGDPWWTAVSAVAWSPTGSVLATATDDHRVEVLHAADGTPVGPAWTTPFLATSLSFSPDGKVLASSGSQGTVTLNDVTTGVQIGPPLVASFDHNTIVQFDPAGRLIVASADGGLWQWHIDLAAMIRTACAIAGRNLSGSEWAMLHTGHPYLAACPQ